MPSFVRDQVQRLIDGNRRYAEGRPLNMDRNAARRGEIAKGQKPFAIVLTCSDSRVPPELLFDQGLGQLFVIRTAGNVTDDIALGSIEYAAEHLNTRLIVVLGHERCGAVEATVKGGELPGHIGAIGAKIKPAVAIGKAFPGDQVDNCVRANIVNVMTGLRESKPILAEMVEKGEVAVVGARYDLDDGLVTWIP
jgi:carbonic anhydrase